jgi:hypothetical protein
MISWDIFWWVLDEFDGKAELNLENLKTSSQLQGESLQR